MGEDIKMTSAGKIRWATEADFDQLGEVMFDAVRNGRSAYSEAQRAAWAPEPRHGDEWAERLCGHSIVLQAVGPQIIGFMSLAPDGYIDLAFIRPAAQKSGLFRTLYHEIERKAINDNAERLWTYASLMAQPGFSAMGFAIVKNERVEISGHWFDRFEMEKRLKGKGV